jgi:hypothetical protein
MALERPLSARSPTEGRWSQTLFFLKKEMQTARDDCAEKEFEFLVRVTLCQGRLAVKKTTCKEKRMWKAGW